MIRFLLPSDSTCPKTPDVRHDSSRGHRPSPALRLRSRRSRLRWEKRSAEAGRTTDSSQEGQELSNKVDETQTKGEKEEEKEKIKSVGTEEVVNESEELFSTSESESPSLLLTHWNSHAHTKTGDVTAKEMQGDGEQRKKESELRTEGKEASETLSTSLLLNHRNTGIKGEDCTLNGRKTDDKEGGDDAESGGEIILREENCNKEQNTENEKTTEVKEEKSGTETADGKSGGVLDSCTLVEGLLFPVEYYVRTTRRMTSSQSQPDMQAVLLSQLSTGRPRQSRRGRGRGRGPSRHTHVNDSSDQRTETVFSSSSPLSTVEPHESSSHASPEMTGRSGSSSEMSNIISPSQADVDVDTLSSPAGSTPCPGRGRRGRRGRGKGRGRGRGGAQIPPSPLNLEAHQSVFEPSTVSLSSSLHEPDGAKSCLAPSAEPVPVSVDPQPDSTHTADDPPSPPSGVDGHEEKVYPIFLRSSGRENASTRTSKSKFCL